MRLGGRGKQALVYTGWTVLLRKKGFAVLLRTSSGRFEERRLCV